MEFLKHRSNEELADLQIASDHQHLKPVLDALPVWARAAGDRSPEFWDRQRAEILSRVALTQNQAAFGISGAAWTLAAAILAIASFLLASGPRVTPSPQAQSDPDRELLIEVEYAVESGGPEALEPAALLAEEIGRYQQANSTSPMRKEVNDEE
jgi:hypothetical protein